MPKQAPLIYRIETKEGHGPYVLSEVVSDFCSQVYDFPGPRDDDLLRSDWASLKQNNEYKKFRFGCHGMARMRRLLAMADQDAIAELRDNGFRLVVLRAERAYYGRHQCIFDPETATVLKTLEIPL